MLTDLGTAAGDQLGRRGAAVSMLRPIYSRWLRTAYGRHGVPWHVNGEPIRIDPDARHLVPHDNELALFQFLRDQIAPGDVVFDIGAFLGVYPIMEARWTGDRGRVFAFEPSPGSFALLQRHAEMNGLPPARLTATCAAIGARAEHRELIAFDGEPYRNMLGSAVEGDATDFVEVLTVDDVAAATGRMPDWIRMDVQGLEFEVLRGASHVLRTRGRDLRIVAEMHPDQWPEYGVDPRDAAEQFAALGLRARSLVPGEPTFVQGAHAILEPLT